MNYDILLAPVITEKSQALAADNVYVFKVLKSANKTQIKTWMRWYKTGQTYRFSQQVGKQYSYGKESEEMSELEELKLKNKQLEAQLAIIKKYQEIERSWSHESLSKL